MAINSLSAGTSLSDSCAHTTVHNGANVNFIASKIIYLKPGFNSENGSTFKASIETNTGSGGRRFASVEVPVKVTNSESKILVYPNPHDGVFVVDFGDKQFNGSSIIYTTQAAKYLKR